MFVTGIEEEITEQDLKYVWKRIIHRLIYSPLWLTFLLFRRDFFYAFGEIKSVVVVYKSRCAFINYATRVGAENAAERTSEAGCIIKGHTLRVAWGRPRPQGPRSAPKPAASAATGSNGESYHCMSCGRNSRAKSFLPYLATKEISLADLKIPAPPSSAGKQTKYPSQDPTYQGSRA